MSFTSTYYRGHDVLTEMPNAHGDRDESETVASDLLDNGIGQVAISRAWASPVMTRPWLFTLINRAAITDFRAWCALRRGAYHELWVPTWRRDFQLVGDQGASDTELVVYDTDYTENEFPRESRRHLAVIVPGGGVRTVYCRRIEDAADNGDGTETITIDSAVGVPLDVHCQLSFLVLARLESDDIPVQYHHLGLAEAAVRFVELPRQVEAVAEDEEEEAP